MDSKTERDLTGQRFGRLVVIDRNFEKVTEASEAHHRKYWNCLCDCGNMVIVREDGLLAKTKPTRSCGCLRRERISEYMKEHPPQAKYGDSRERIHNIWYLMLYRCNNETSPAYYLYGGRGIKVCPEWDDGINGYFKFKEWAMSNGYAETLTLERIDVNKGYTPSNCKWIPMKEQANNKQNTFYAEYNGEVKRLKEWADILGIDYKALFSRIKYQHLTLEEAVAKPFRKKRNNADAAPNTSDN